MSEARPAPRWGAAAISYIIASLATGFVLSGIENLSDLFSGDAGATTVANAVIAAFVYAGVAGLNLVLPVLVVGLVFWWFRIDSLAAYVGAAGVIAGAMVAAGFTFNDLELIPAALVGGLVFWACMKLAPKAESTT